ncbi:MAG: hypothetical protein ISR52_02225 [Rhodospirillales bacterium]|nr:hypothetical protein [Rhodospirillales bacterium]
MKNKLITRIFIAAAFGLLAVFAQPATAQAELRLSDNVKQHLIAAKPVKGPGVDRQLFNGKPVLVVFFASW